VKSRRRLRCENCALASGSASKSADQSSSRDCPSPPLRIACRGATMPNWLRRWLPPRRSPHRLPVLGLAILAQSRTEQRASRQSNRAQNRRSVGRATRARTCRSVSLGHAISRRSVRRSVRVGARAWGFSSPPMLCLSCWSCVFDRGEKDRSVRACGNLFGRVDGSHLLRLRPHGWVVEHCRRGLQQVDPP
jgi:hypothetical protein